MTKIGTMKIAGKSGNEYEFQLYPVGTSFKELGGVYVVTKREPKPGGGGAHTFLYVGETGDFSTRFDNHHKQECFDESGANCIGVHLDGSEKSRKAKEADLLEGNAWPCND